MEVSSIQNFCFKGLYKIDRKFVGDNTERFIYSNDDVIVSQKHYEDDIFVYTPDNKDNEIEECVKNDNGKYWKSKPLSELMMYSNLLNEIFRVNYYSNGHKQDWTDYTENWQSPEKDSEDDLPF